MTNFNPKLAEVVARDPRYAYEAYEFIYQALGHTQKMLGREPPAGSSAESLEPDLSHHVKGQELLQGIREFALQEFGLMARTVFHMWGITKTEDFGNIIFNLVDAELMQKTPDDSIADFQNVFDFDQALVQGFSIRLD